MSPLHFPGFVYALMPRPRTHLFSALAVLGIVAVVGMSSARAQDELSRQAVGMMQVGDVSESVMRTARTSVAGPDRAGKDGPMAAVGLELAILYHQERVAGEKGVQMLRDETRARPKAGKDGSPKKQGRVHSPISADGRFVTVEAIASDGTARLLSDLRDLGLDAGATAGNVVSGRLPISSIRDAASLSSLRGMMPAYARTSAGSVGSEADTAHAAYEVRSQTGLDGSGQKVCVLSDTYNQNSSVATSASEDVQSGDLPGSGNPEGHTTPVDVREDGPSGTDEGRAMLQLIHDIAPGAALGYHTALGGLGAFASGIRELGDPSGGDCTMIVDDIRYNTQPFYQDGPVANAVDDVVNNDGVPYFSSAGNEGQNSYEAPFRDSGQPGVINSSSVAHDFDSTSTTDTRQAITIQPGGTFEIFSFQWTDPSAQVSPTGPDTDINIALVDGNDNIEAESSIANVTDGRPVEWFDYTNDTDSEVTRYLVIEKATGPDPDEIKYVYSGSGPFTDSDVTIDEYDTHGPTIFGHPTAEGAFATAAAPFYYTREYCSDPSTSNCIDGEPPSYLEPFSSKGGIPILFGQNGNQLLAPETREKPDITGTDGIDNTFLGFDLSPTQLNGIDPDPHPNFFGTSAAAPNVAGIAALIKQARGDTPTEVYDRLESTASDVTRRITRDNALVSIASGWDPWSGHGFVEALDAVPAPVITDLTSTTTDPATGSVELTWTESDDDIVDYKIERRYFNDPFEVVADPDGPPVTLDNLGLGAFTFRVRWTKADGTQGTSTAVSDTLGIQEFEGEVASEDEVGRRTVALSWDVPMGTENFSFRIERQNGAKGFFVGVGTTSQTSFKVKRQVPGTYNYRVISVDNQGNALTSPPLRQDIALEDPAFAVGPYPNPVQGEASLDLTAQNDQPITVEVFNTIGERVYHEDRDVDALTPVTLSLDVGQWSSGVYFLRVRGDEFTKTRRMIVVR